MEVASSADGNWMVLQRPNRGDRAEAQLWQVKPLRLRQVFNPPYRFLVRASMNATGSHFAYSSSSNYFGAGTAEVLVRSTGSGRVVARFVFDTPVFAIALSPDAQLIAIAHGQWWGSGGQTYVSVYRVTDRTLLYRLVVFTRPVST